MSLRDYIWADRHGPKPPKRGPIKILYRHRKHSAHENWRWPFSMYVETASEPIVLITKKHDLHLGVPKVSENQLLETLNVTRAKPVEHIAGRAFETLGEAKRFTDETDERKIRHVQDGFKNGKKNYLYVGYESESVEKQWGAYWTDRIKLNEREPLEEAGRIWIDRNDWEHYEKMTVGPDELSQVPYIDTSGKRHKIPLSELDLEWLSVVPNGIEPVPWVNENSLDAPRKDRPALAKMFPRFLLLACKLAIERDIKSVTISGRHRKMLKSNPSPYVRNREFTYPKEYQFPNSRTTVEKAMTEWETLEKRRHWRGKWEDENLLSMMYEPEWIHLKRDDQKYPSWAHPDPLMHACHRFPVHLRTAKALREMIMKRSEFDYRDFDPTRWYNH